MRILIIDSSRQFMGRVRRLLASGLPDVEVTEYDAVERGLPDGEFDWALYDLLVMSLELGDGSEGLHWLQALHGLTGFPPTLILAEQVDVYGAVRLMRAGAADLLLRADLSTAALVARARELARPVSPLLASPAREVIITQTLARESGRAQTVVRLGQHDYAFLRLIGQGGMARAYLVRRAQDRALLVMKTIGAERLVEATTRERFLVEAELARAVDHAHVVRVADHGMCGEVGMIAMEFFPGGDLKRRIEDGMSAGAALDCLRQIGLAIEALGRAGIVHRDLKPGNLMFRADGALALADFGIAKRLGARRTDTTFGRITGTPAYFSPEQARGVEVDTRSDLYCAGVIFYEMLLGRRPFETDGIESLIYSHVHAPVPPLPVALAHCQPLIERLLAKDPSRRFANGAALVAAIDALGVTRRVSGAAAGSAHQDTSARDAADRNSGGSRP